MLAAVRRMRQERWAPLSGVVVRILHHGVKALGANVARGRLASILG
jgi:hypothetical protein